MNRVWAIIRKEFIQIVRDPRTLAIVLVMPVMQLVLLGYAINTVVDHIRTVVADQAMDERSRSFVQALASTTYFDVVRYVDDPREARRAVDRGEAKVALVIPPDFSAKLRAGRPAQVQVLVDGSDPNTAQTALFGADAVARVKSAELLSTGSRGAGAQGEIAMPIDLRPTVLYNPSLESVNFMIPGLIGMILQMQGFILTAFAIVRERERGTLEQLIVTPIKPWELMLGKILPYVLIAFVNVGVVLAVGLLWFRIGFAGSVTLLLALSLVFLLGSLGVGLFISTISRTQTQAMQTAMFIMLPSFILSGFFFPREAMPPLIGYFSYLIPLTYFLEIIRGIILKGSPLNDLWPQVIPLAAFGLLVFGVSAVRFRKSME